MNTATCLYDCEGNWVGTSAVCRYGCLGQILYEQGTYWRVIETQRSLDPPFRAEAVVVKVAPNDQATGAGQGEVKQMIGLDHDGYPTEESLDVVRSWPAQDFDGLIKFITPAFYYGRISRDGDGRWSVSTGGWSGCEDVIEAMKYNAVWWMAHWESSRRGGHHRFGRPTSD